METKYAYFKCECGADVCRDIPCEKCGKVNTHYDALGWLAKKMKFFKSPCFACQCLTSDNAGGDYSEDYPVCGREYGTHLNKAYLESESEIFEHWNMNKKTFPQCEAPKKCLRKNYWKFEDQEVHSEYFGILGKMEDSFGSFSLNFEHPLKVLSREVAWGISSFNGRMRQIKSA